MDGRIKKALASAGVLAAFGLGGAAIAGAQGGEGKEQEQEQEQKVTGPDADRAGQAALKVTGGGKVVEVEKETPEKGDSHEAGEKESAKERAIDQKTAYSVEIKKADGKTVDVALDDAFKVLASEQDSESGAEADGEARGR